MNDKIKVLESAFTDDQGRDDQYYEKRIKQLNDELEEANIKLQELQRREAFIKKKFEIIKLEENNI